MTLLRRAATSVVALTVVFAGLVSIGPAAQASTASSLFSLTNASRASAGMAPYAYSSELSAVALSRAESMVAHNTLTHAGLASAVGNWSYLGENVGYGPSASALEVAFMNSPDHRANILDHDFTQVGVGAVTVGTTVWVSVIFRRPLHATPASSAPRAHVSQQAVLSSTSTTAKAALQARAATQAAHACLVSPLASRQILAIASQDHLVRLVAQSRRLVVGYQCGKHLPMTGLLNTDTLRALTG
jgi:Cysteine-rich secretory protein family